MTQAAEVPAQPEVEMAPTDWVSGESADLGPLRAVALALVVATIGGVTLGIRDMQTRAKIEAVEAKVEASEAEVKALRAVLDEVRGNHRELMIEMRRINGNGPKPMGTIHPPKPPSAPPIDRRSWWGFR